MYPQKDITPDLPDGHTHQAFILEFDRPVKKLIDIYTCIGCGAKTNNAFVPLHSDYNSGSSDSLETIHKGLPFEPWFSAMEVAIAPNYNLTVDGKTGRLGGQGDVWEKATQEIPDKTFTKAYGFIPNSSTITWRLSGESSKVRIQKVPGHDDFDNLDWNPPPGSGGEIEIPLTEPEFPAPDPGADIIPPEADFPTIDVDPTGGEPEIVPLEPDITPDPDIPEVDPVPDIVPPEIDPTPDAPNTDPTPDTGERDPGDPDPGDGERPEDFD